MYILNIITILNHISLLWSLPVLALMSFTAHYAKVYLGELLLIADKPIVWLESWGGRPKFSL
jgi:hypothetical protein